MTKEHYGWTSNGPAITPHPRIQGIKFPINYSRAIFRNVTRRTIIARQTRQKIISPVECETAVGGDVVLENNNPRSFLIQNNIPIHLPNVDGETKHNYGSFFVDEDIDFSNKSTVKRGDLSRKSKYWFSKNDRVIIPIWKLEYSRTKGSWIPSRSQNNRT